MALPGPDEHNPADVPTDIDKLRKAIDALSMIYLQGTTATRPAAGVAGRLYFSTDEHLLFYDDGSVWRGTVTPTGTLQMTAAAAGLAGWLLCDGAAYPRAEYSALFAVIGTAWGAGDGSSTFNVPDLRGRAPMGAGTGAGLSPRAVGQRGGEEAHTLIVGELAAHQHKLRKTDQALGSGGLGVTLVGDSPGYEAGVEWNVGYIEATGGGAAHNNMQPFAVVNYLIKT
jgi:microcystin-dependent protein